MARVPGQNLTVVDSPPLQSRPRVHQQDNCALNWESVVVRWKSYWLMGGMLFHMDTDTPILDETVAIVKEKVWSFRTALKRAASDACVQFGFSPTLVGYSSLPLGEDNELAQKNEAEVALQKVINDEMLSSSAISGRSEESIDNCKIGEESRLVHHEEDGDDSNHAFVEASRKARDEQKSLMQTWQADGLDYDKDQYLRDG